MTRLLLATALLLTPATAGAQRAIPPYIDTTVTHQLALDQSVGRPAVYCAFGERVTGRLRYTGPLMWAAVNRIEPDTTPGALRCPPDAVGAFVVLGSIRARSAEHLWAALQMILSENPTLDFAGAVVTVEPVARADGPVLVPRIAVALQARQGSE